MYQIYLIVGDSDLVLLASTLVTSRHVQDTICIDVEGDLNLRDTSWGRRDGGKVKLSKEMIILGHGPLSFIHLDSDGWLVIGIRGEGLGLLGRNSGVPLDKAGHNTASRLDPERKGSNIKQ